MDEALRSAVIRVLSAARGEGGAGGVKAEFRAAMAALEEALQPLRVEDLLDGLPRCACGIPGPEKERECHADYYDGETFAIDSGGEYGPTNVCKCGCHRPRLSTEAEAKAAMGDSQPLVRMREIGK